MQSEILITSASVSDRGLSDKRPQNEDSYLDLPESGLFAVADGVGGAQAGEVASQMAMEILGEAFVNLQEDGDAEDRMKVAIERANSAIFQMANDLPQLSSMATTVVALHLNGNIATIGHVGDSRLYRLDSEGNLHRETLDHSVVEEQVRAGMMTPEQAAVHPSRNVISRALGAEPLVEVDLKTMMVEGSAVFLACSDGVTRHIEDDELRELLSGAPDNDILCQTIKDICYERGAEDNLTAVAVRLEALSVPEYEEQPEHADAGLELEEETVATARAAAGAEEMFDATADAPADATSDEIGYSEAPAEGAEEPFIEMDAPTAEGVEVPADQPESDSISIQASKSQSFLSILSDEDGEGSADAGDAIEAVSERSSGSGSAILKILSGFVLLLIGAGIGAAGYYFWSLYTATPPAEPEIPQPVAITTFEQTRTKVISDPEAALAALSASPQNSEDYYFLGLANILTGNTAEAVTALEQASAKLGDFEESERDQLSKEIAILRVVSEDPDAAAKLATLLESSAGEPDGGDEANANAGAEAAGPQN